MKIKIYVVILNVLLTHITFSQITGNDNTWEIVFNDNFTIFEPTYWLNCYSWSHINGGDEYNDPLNVTTSNGYLIITAEELNENTKIPYQGRDYYYKSGAINSNTNVKYKYGYFEISAIFPVGYGYWPAFWLLTSGSNNGYYWYNEIDIVENGGYMSESGFILGYNLHYYYGTDPDYVDKNLGYDLFNNDKPFNLIKLTESMTQEHIYGLFWEPSKFTIFFDNKEIASYYDEEHMPNHRLNILINFAIDPWYKPKTETNFPATFKVNYINIYQLKYTDDCSEVVEPFNKISYTNSVKKSVVLENTSLSLSDNIHIWATDYILFNSVTEISTSTNGSFSVYVTSCPINVD